MTDAEQIAAVLAEHRYVRVGGVAPRCACGDGYPHGAFGIPTPTEWHEAHLAAVLLPLVDDAAREAAAKAWREGAAAGHHSPLTWFALRQVNPYRIETNQ